MFGEGCVDWSKTWMVELRFDGTTKSNRTIVGCWNPFKVVFGSDIGNCILTSGLVGVDLWCAL